MTTTLDGHQFNLRDRNLQSKTWQNLTNCTIGYKPIIFDGTNTHFRSFPQHSYIVSNHCNRSPNSHTHITFDQQLKHQRCAVCIQVIFELKQSQTLCFDAKSVATRIRGLNGDVTVNHCEVIVELQFTQNGKC